MLMMHNFLSDIELANIRLFFRNINKRVFFVVCFHHSSHEKLISALTLLLCISISELIEIFLLFSAGFACCLSSPRLHEKIIIFLSFFLFISSSERSGNWTDTVVGKLNYKNVSLFAPCIHHDVIASLY